MPAAIIRAPFVVAEDRTEDETGAAIAPGISSPAAVAAAIAAPPTKVTSTKVVFTSEAATVVTPTVAAAAMIATAMAAVPTAVVAAVSFSKGARRWNSRAGYHQSDRGRL